MKHWKRTPLLLVSVVATLVLSGCGGGGGSDDDATNPTNTTAQGRFIDAPVEGLSYTSGDITGVTDSNGTFTYEVGSTVVFRVSNIEIGSVMGAETITPLDLVPNAADETDDTVVNILRFLQSLDTDGDPENGVTISATVQNTQTNETIDFNQTVSDFETDPALVTWLAALPLEEIGNDRDLVAAIDALFHFRVTLASLEEQTDLEELTEISLSEVDALISTGVWRTKVDFSFEAETQFTFGNQSYVIDTSADIESTDIIAITDITSTSQTQLSCYVNGPETLTFEDIADVEEEFCDDQTAEYYRSSDNQEFVMVLYCAGEAFGRLDFRKLTDSTAFNQGSVAFSSGLYPDIDVDNGVCGGLSDLETESTYTPSNASFPDDMFAEYSISFMAPYGDGDAWFEITFPEEPGSGTYQVIDASSGAFTTGTAVIRMHTSNSALGGTPDNPEVFSGVSGSVIISTLSDYSAAGSFDLVMDNSDTLTGAFSFVLD
jgi:hypothetical protein